jgi:hypothetical protein
VFRLIVRSVSAVMFVGGVIGLITVPDDLSVWQERLGPRVMALDRETILLLLFGTSSAGFAWTIFGPSIAARLRRRRRGPLAVEFSELHGLPTFPSRQYQSVSFHRVGPTGGIHQECVVIRRVCFLVRNESDKSVYGVSAAVRSFSAGEWKNDRPLRQPTKKKRPKRRTRSAPVDWPLPAVNSTELLYNLNPKSDVPFMLFEKIEFHDFFQAGEIKAADDATFANLKARCHEAFFGGLDVGHPILTSNGLTVGVAVHARDVEPTYLQFHVDLLDPLGVRFRKVTSFDE